MHVTAQTLVKELYAEWKRDETSRHAAAIAYYTVFSLPAFILIVLSVASATLGGTTVNDQVFGTISMYIGEATAELLKATLRNIQQSDADLSWVGIIGFVVLIVGATGVIRELQKTLNRILGIHAGPQSFAHKVWTYVFSLLLLLVTAGILVTSIVSGALIGVMSQKVAAVLSVPIDIISLVHNIVTYATLTVMLFFLYTFLPRKRFPFLISFLSAVIASSLLVIGTIIASYYIARSGLGKAYGVAANVLILLFWIYFGANVFLFGAQLMEVAQRINTGPGSSRNLLQRLLRLK